MGQSGEHGDTKPGEFFVTPTNVVTVPMMHQKAEFRSVTCDWAGSLPLSLLELPYCGRDFAMIILLPEEMEDLPGITELENQLTPTHLEEWLSKLKQAAPQTMRVGLPRFTFTQSMNVKKELNQPGVTAAFGGFADFSGMDGGTDLYISDVLQQALIEVNEEGTVAAAVTLEVAKPKGMLHSFVANRPFLFLIRDNATGSILFLGRVMDPTMR